MLEQLFGFDSIREVRNLEIIPRASCIRDALVDQIWSAGYVYFNLSQDSYPNVKLCLCCLPLLILGALTANLGMREEALVT